LCFCFSWTSFSISNFCFSSTTFCRIKNWKERKLKKKLSKLKQFLLLWVVKSMKFIRKIQPSFRNFLFNSSRFEKSKSSFNGTKLKSSLLKMMRSINFNKDGMKNYFVEKLTKSLFQYLFFPFNENIFY
jgi:hypothetical protein